MPGTGSGMTTPQDGAPALGQPTDVAADPDRLDEESSEPTPTGTLAGYEQGNTDGGTGGVDAGGAG